jgi:transposase
VFAGWCVILCGMDAGSGDVVVGCKEIADRLGVSENLVATWRRRGLLPTASMTVGGRPAWWLSKIEACDHVRARMADLGELADR